MFEGVPVDCVLQRSPDATGTGAKVEPPSLERHASSTS